MQRLYHVAARPLNRPAARIRPTPVPSSAAAQIVANSYLTGGTSYAIVIHIGKMSVKQSICSPRTTYISMCMSRVYVNLAMATCGSIWRTALTQTGNTRNVAICPLRHPPQPGENQCPLSRESCVCHPVNRDASHLASRSARIRALAAFLLPTVGGSHAPTRHTGRRRRSF
jgi:hypothetical protein